jgi:serine/threonine protein kinase
MQITESAVLKLMATKKGFPKFYGIWRSRQHIAIGMQYLGHSLRTKQKEIRNFSLSTSLELANQMLERIERLHQNNYIHRDIKPSNFVLGREKNDKIVYLIDFGFASIYRDKTSFIHVSPDMHYPFVGTTCYSSTACHLKIKPSRRDDLESWFYSLVEFIKGKLPWNGPDMNENLPDLPWQKAMVV